MLLSSLPDTDGSRCILTFDEPNGWLRATWRGFVDMDEALRGADNYLRQLEGLRCQYLLNDNVALRGPWFDSIDWLEHIWVPRAVDMGLRYVAHVVQSDSLSDIITVNFSTPQVGGLELQIFQQVPEAEEWLRNCQRRAVPA
jgi:dihydroorotate dehydrogenase